MIRIQDERGEGYWEATELKGHFIVEKISRLR